jgi:hypothetical protein
MLLSLLFSTRVFLASWHDKRVFFSPSVVLFECCVLLNTRHSATFSFGANVRSSWDETGGIYLILSSLFRVKRPHIYFFFFLERAAH